MNPRSRTQLRQLAHRGGHDRQALDEILDSALMGHVGFVYEGDPVVIPTLFWRDRDAIYWHGASASRMLRVVDGRDVCVTVSILDGLVLARSAFHHSANYRSAMIFGRARAVTDPKAKLALLKTMMETLSPGRFGQLRPVTERELKLTTVMALPLTEFSTKSRSGDVVEDEADRDWPVWAGVIPFRSTLLAPEPAENATRFEPPKLWRPKP